jgi:hypothetical protein
MNNGSNPDPNRVKARIAGRKFACEVLSTGEDVVVARGPDFCEAYWRMIASLANAAVARMTPPPPPDKPKKDGKPQRTPQPALDEILDLGESEDVKEALAIIDEMEQLAEEIAWEDAPDVLEKAQSIGRTIERTSNVTDNQMTALESMRDAMAAWIRD